MGVFLRRWGQLVWGGGVKKVEVLVGYWIGEMCLGLGLVRRVGVGGGLEFLEYEIWVGGCLEGENYLRRKY